MTKTLLFQLQPKGTYKEKQNNDLWQTSLIGTTCQRTKQYKASLKDGFLCTTTCGIQHSSAMDIPFKHYTAEIPRKPPAHPRRILGRCILTIGQPVITTLTQSCGVSTKKKKEQKTKQKHYARVFSCCNEYLTLFDPQKVGKKAQPMSFISSSSLCYTYRKKKHFIHGLSHRYWVGGFIRVLTWAERDLLRPSSW